LQAIDLRHS